MTHARQSPDLLRLSLSPARQQNLRTGSGGQAQPLSALSKAHARNRASQRRYAARRRAILRAAGLTARGTSPRRIIFVHGHRRLSHRLSERRRRDRLAALGLTSRATPRKRSDLFRPSNPAELAWRQLRATILLPPGGDYLTPAERYEL
jgi:hypothetical protein